MTSCDDNRPLVVLVPARNEESTIGRVVSEAREAVQSDVVVIDDASTDDTARAARDAGAVVLPLVLQLGAWGATRTGIRYAFKNGYRVAATMDGDGQHPAESLHKILEPIVAGSADVVIGSYIARGSWARKCSWTFFRRFTRLGVEDLTSGLRAYNWRAMQALMSRKTSLLEYQDIGVLLHLRKAGCRITEVPVIMNLRSSGHSRVFSSWWRVWCYLLHTMVLSFCKFGSSVKKDKGPG